MALEYLIRSEKVSDIAEISRVVTAAFETDAEARLVENLRNQGALTFSLIAENKSNQQILAHLALSVVTIDNGQRSWQALGLAPLSVLPEFHNKGIGSALIHFWFEHYADDFYNAVVLLGEPAYYRRFQFSTAADFDLRWEFECPEEAFMVREIKKDFLKKASGTVYYHAAFSEL